MTAPIAIRRSAQRGVVLFIALIVLVAMSLTGLALMRSLDTGTLIARNLAFRQSTIHGSDQGLENARAWLLANSGSLGDNAAGYFAAAQSGLDLLGNDPTKPDFDWSTAIDLGTDAAGNRVLAVIHRMCDEAGPSEGKNCIRANLTSGFSAKKSGVHYGTQGFALGAPVYFRVTVKVTGPRNSVAYVQSMMY